MINHLDVGRLVFSLTVFAIYKWLQCSGIFFRQQRLRTSVVVSFLCIFAEGLYAVWHLLLCHQVEMFSCH